MRKGTFIKRLTIVGAILLLNVSFVAEILAEYPLIEWSIFQNLNGGNHTGAITTDSSGNIYVAHEVSPNMVTTKYSNSGYIIWERQSAMNSDSSDILKSDDIIVDPLGNVYVRQSTDGIVKYSAEGVEQWNTKYDSTFFKPHSMAIDKNGSVYLLGKEYSSETKTIMHVLIKYDGNGRELWVRNYDYGQSSYAGWFVDVAVDSENNVVFTGEVSDGLNNSGSIGIAVVKHDGNGNQLWAKKYSINTNVEPRRLAVDLSDNVIVSGQTTGSHSDLITVKYNNSGQLLWANRYDSGGYDRSKDVLADSKGNIYVSARTSSAGVYDGTSTSSSDIGTIKYDSNGNMLWANIYDSGSTDYTNGIALDEHDNVYVSGFCNYGCQNYWRVIKYDACGNEMWVDTQIPGYRPYALDTNISGDLFVLAYAYGEFTLVKYRNDYYGADALPACDGSETPSETPEEPTPTPEEPAPPVEEPAPPVEEPTPPIEDPTPPVDETPEPPLPTRSIEIDILPGNAYNAFNLKSGKAVPVAVLTTADFNAADVDPSSVAFGPAGAGAIRGEGSLQDVDNDGDLDAVFTFKGRMTGLTCDDNEATLSAKTSDGQPVSGIDSIGRSRWCK